MSNIRAGTSVDGEDRDRQSGEMAVLRVSAVTRDGFKPSECKVVASADLHRVSTPVEAGTIAFSRSNTPDLVGLSSYIESSDSNLYHSDKLWQINANEDYVLPRFLGFLLQTNGLRLQFAKRSSGSSGSMYNISQKSFLDCATRIPCKCEQEAILEVLDVAEASVRAADQLIEKKVLAKRAIAQELLTGRRPLSRDSSKWTRVKIGDLFEEVERYEEWDDATHYRLLSIRRRSGGLFDRGILRGEEILTKVMKKVHADDFLISKMQVVHGAWGRVTKEFHLGNVSNSYICLVPKNTANVDMRFFDQLSRLPLMYNIALRSSYGVHIEKMTFRLDLFLSEKIRLPKIEEQRQIADLLDNLDNEITLLRKQRNALFEQKQGLMQRLLTGEIRLKDFR